MSEDDLDELERLEREADRRSREAEEDLVIAIRNALPDLIRLARYGRILLDWDRETPIGADKVERFNALIRAMEPLR